jgi:hypothetical protein
MLLKGTLDTPQNILRGKLIQIRLIYSEVNGDKVHYR